MPRPKASASQQGRAYQLYHDKLGPTAIFDKLCEEFENPVSARTVSAWMRGFRGLTEEVKKLDVPFEYHRMQEYGLPWEASRYVLRLWAFVTSMWPIFYKSAPRPTFREVRWWWRVHLAVPELDFYDVWQLAWRFTLREQRHELLGASPVWRPCNRSTAIASPLAACCLRSSAISGACLT